MHQLHSELSSLSGDQMGRHPSPFTLNTLPYILQPEAKCNSNAKAIEYPRLRARKLISALQNLTKFS